MVRQRLGRRRAARWSGVSAMHDSAARRTAPADQPQRGAGALLSHRDSSPGFRRSPSALEGVVPVDVEASQAGTESDAGTSVGAELVKRVAVLSTLRFGA